MPKPRRDLSMANKVITISREFGTGARTIGQKLAEELGFAYYDKGRLCLLHASSGKGKVIKETLPLCDYLANNKRHTGIRVFRVSF